MMARRRRDHSTRLALVPVRDGVVPAGGAETVAECGGRVMLIGSDVDGACEELTGVASDVTLCEMGDYAPAAWARTVAELVNSGRIEDVDAVVLPASPDGRDLAPRLSARLSWELIASAIRIDTDQVQVLSHGGRATAERRLREGDRVVVTFQPGARNVVVPEDGPAADVVTIEVDRPGDPTGLPSGEGVAVDPVCEALLPPDVSTMDLSEAPRLFGGGAGLDSSERFEQLARVASMVDAAMGATRVITDKGWLGHERQIGTTGVVVDPDLYVSFGISGAVQHTAGLGHPDHIISVNTDEHCPMMEMADLAVVADANETLEHLEAMLTDDTRTDATTASTGTTETDREAERG